MSKQNKSKNGKVRAVPATPSNASVGAQPKSRRAAKGKRDGRNLAARLAPFIGRVKDLPPDLSVRLDQYLYGLPEHK
jgi:hypothetical protein